MKNTSHLVIGTMKWGSWGENFSVSKATEFLIKCYENGFVHFDLADIYGNYQTENLFGQALKNSQINRKKIFITTKFGIEYPCENSNFKIKTYNSSAEYFKSSIQRSLNELQVDYIDQYLLHRPDYLINGNELAEIVEKKITKSIILNFGVSNCCPIQFDFLNNYIDLSTNQIQFSVNHIKPLEKNHFLYFQDKEVPLMIWSPLGNIFSEDNEVNQRIKKTLNELSIKYNLSYSQLLIMFIKKIPCIIQPILGSTKIERLIEIKKCFNQRLEREDWYKILESIKGKRVA